MGEISLELGRQQSAKLPLMVKELLSTLAMSLNEIELISVANGPGYYTGIRAGIAYSAALAKALEIKVVAVSSMELFVFDLRDRGILLAPIIKARQNCIYCALYLSDGAALNTYLPPNFCSAADFADFLIQYPDALIVGDDRRLYPEFSPLANDILSRTTGFAGQTALMGEYYRNYAVNPDRVRGEYLREPDIGPTVKQ